MPAFDDSARSAAPPEAVWKLLYDPARFPEWWKGMETVQLGGDGDFVFYPEGYPDFPMPQQIRGRREDGSVVVSCLVSDLVFDWRLSPLDGGTATRVDVHVEIPEREAARLDTQRETIRASLRRLAELAAADPQGPVQPSR